MARRWVCIAIKKNRTAVSARACLKELAKAAPFRIGTLPTDDGTEFTDRLSGSRARQPRGEHGFDGLYQAPEIKHRQTRPRGPQRNGMVEPFNGHLGDLLKPRQFNSRKDMVQTLLRCYVFLYNQPGLSRKLT